jgi:hypothetical protein
VTYVSASDAREPSFNALKKGEILVRRDVVYDLEHSGGGEIVPDGRRRSASPTLARF